MQITTSAVAASTTTAVTSSVNPSTVGEAVTFTATVTSGGSPVTTGTVTFTDGATTLATVALGGAGQASFTTSALVGGSHTSPPPTNGTAAFQMSSGSVTQVVQRATTSTALTSSVNPSTVGQWVAFTAGVTSDGGNPVTTGTVDFTDGGAILATVALDSSGQTTFSTSALTAGSHTITATYNGTAAFLPSSDSVTQVVQSGAPACADDAGSTSEDVQLADSLACTDPNGDSLTYAEVAGPSNGTLQLNSDGSFTYDPDPDFNGTDSFTFSANDGTDDSNVATYTVSVGMANDAPILGPILPQMATEGSTVSFTATASDIDLPPDTLTFSLAGGPSGATIDPNSGVFSWFAPDDGISTFDVCVSDGSLSDCEPVTVTITNVAPTVTLFGPATAVAGQTLTYTYTITDPGADTHTVLENCGAGAVVIDTPALNSFDCRFAAGPATTMVSVISDDGGESNALGTASVDVTVAAAHRESRRARALDESGARPVGRSRDAPQHGHAGTAQRGCGALDRRSRAHQLPSAVGWWHRPPPDATSSGPLPSLALTSAMSPEPPTGVARRFTFTAFGIGSMTPLAGEPRTGPAGQREAPIRAWMGPMRASLVPHTDSNR